jgi:hypothetical protein
MSECDQERKRVMKTATWISMIFTSVFKWRLSDAAGCLMD